MDTQNSIESLARRAKVASIELRTLSSATKNAALETMAQSIVERQAEIFAANAVDVENAKQKGLEGALLDRMTLSDQKIAAMADGCRQVAALPAFRHLGGANYLMADGSVHWLKPPEVTTFGGRKDAFAVK